jgi:hypothetical protein
MPQANNGAVMTPLAPGLIFAVTLLLLCVSSNFQCQAPKSNQHLQKFPSSIESRSVAHIEKHDVKYSS